MKFKLYEYNVVKNMDDKNTTIIKLEENRLTYNDKIITDENIIIEISNLLNEFKDDIINLSEMEVSCYKGGRQEELSICYGQNDNSQYMIFGNTDFTDMVNLYNEIKESIIRIIG